MKAIGSHLFLLLALLPLSLSAQAGQCKPLEQTQCQAEPACAWVNGYARKDGRQVRAYCRAAPKPRSAASQQTDGANS